MKKRRVVYEETEEQKGEGNESSGAGISYERGAPGADRPDAAGIGRSDY